MRKVLLPPVTLTILADLKTLWRVSLQTLLRQAQTLNITTLSQARALHTRLEEWGCCIQEPVEVPIGQPRAQAMGLSPPRSSRMS
jgi:hypothetical protein